MASPGPASDWVARGLRPRGFGRLLHFGPHPWIALLIVVCLVVVVVVVARRRR